MCYQWRLVVTDRVSLSTAYTSTNELKIDRTRPTGAFTVPADAANIGGSGVNADGGADNGTANDASTRVAGGSSSSQSERAR